MLCLSEWVRLNRRGSGLMFPFVALESVMGLLRRRTGWACMPLVRTGISNDGSLLRLAEGLLERMEGVVSIVI